MLAGDLTIEEFKTYYINGTVSTKDNVQNIADIEYHKTFFKVMIYGRNSNLFPYIFVYTDKWIDDDDLKIRFLFNTVYPNNNGLRLYKMKDIV